MGRIWGKGMKITGYYIREMLPEEIKTVVIISWDE